MTYDRPALQCHVVDLTRFSPSPFLPHPVLRSGHAQTVATTFVTKSLAIPVSEVMVVPVERIGEPLQSNVRCDCTWQPDSKRTALIIHGLGGSSRSSIVLGMAQTLLEAGYHV